MTALPIELPMALQKSVVGCDLSCPTCSCPLDETGAPSEVVAGPPKKPCKECAKKKALRLARENISMGAPVTFRDPDDKGQRIHGWVLVVRSKTTPPTVSVTDARDRVHTLPLAEVNPFLPKPKSSFVGLAGYEESSEGESTSLGDMQDGVDDNETAILSGAGDVVLSGFGMVLLQLLIAAFGTVLGALGFSTVMTVLAFRRLIKATKEAGLEVVPPDQAKEIPAGEGKVESKKAMLPLFQEAFGNEVGEDLLDHALRSGWAFRIASPATPGGSAPAPASSSGHNPALTHLPSAAASAPLALPVASTEKPSDKDKGKPNKALTQLPSAAASAPLPSSDSPSSTATASSPDNPEQNSLGDFGEDLFNGITSVVKQVPFFGLPQLAAGAAQEIHDAVENKGDFGPKGGSPGSPSTGRSAPASQGCIRPGLSPRAEAGARARGIPLCPPSAFRPPSSPSSSPSETSRASTPLAPPGSVPPSRSAHAHHRVKIRQTPGSILVTSVRNGTYRQRWLVGDDGYTIAWVGHPVRATDPNAPAITYPPPVAPSSSNVSNAPGASGPSGSSAGPVSSALPGAASSLSSALSSSPNPVTPNDSSSTNPDTSSGESSAMSFNNESEAYSEVSGGMDIHAHNVMGFVTGQAMGAIDDGVHYVPPRRGHYYFDSPEAREAFNTGLLQGKRWEAMKENRKRAQLSYARYQHDVAIAHARHRAHWRLMKEGETIKKAIASAVGPMKKQLVHTLNGVTHALHRVASDDQAALSVATSNQDQIHALANQLADNPQTPIQAPPQAFSQVMAAPEVQSIVAQAPPPPNMPVLPTDVVQQMPTSPSVTTTVSTSAPGPLATAADTTTVSTTVSTPAAMAPAAPIVPVAQQTTVQAVPALAPAAAVLNQAAAIPPPISPCPVGCMTPDEALASLAMSAALGGGSGTDNSTNILALLGGGTQVSQNVTDTTSLTDTGVDTSLQDLDTNDGDSSLDSDLSGYGPGGQGGLGVDLGSDLGLGTTDDGLLGMGDDDLGYGNGGLLGWGEDEDSLEGGEDDMGCAACVAGFEDEDE